MSLSWSEFGKNRGGLNGGVLSVDWVVAVIVDPNSLPISEISS